MKKICFVCDANECRSPMAEKMFACMLKNAGIKNVVASSAGLGATEGANMSLQAKRALKTLGYKVGNKKSTQLKAIVPDVLYVTMTNQQKNYLNKKNVLAFGDIVGGTDVSDPYGQPQKIYDETAKQIETYCKKLLDKVAKI